VFYELPLGRGGILKKSKSTFRTPLNVATWREPRQPLIRQQLQQMAETWRRGAQAPTKQTRTSG
jgi:hypothetical protein